jgi:hypothetical protein
MKTTTLINGREATIFYRESRSQKKDQPRLNTLQVYRVLEELLKGERGKVYDKGITVLNSFTNIDGAKMWGDSRPSNAIVELRKVIPKSGLITFQYAGVKRDRYALINDSNIIDFADNLLKEIRKKISKEV